MNVHTYIHTYKWVYQLVRLSVVLTFYRMLLISHCVLYEGMFVFQLRPRHSTTNSTIAMWCEYMCVFVVCTYQVIYFIGCSYVRILVVVEKAFLCFRSVCPSVRPSIRPFVCHLVSRQPNQRQLLKCIIFSSFFLLLPFHLYTLTHSLAVFFACLCFFRGLYMDFITFKSRKNQQAIPNNNNKNKNKKELCSELSFFTVAAAATKQRIVLCVR